MSPATMADAGDWWTDLLFSHQPWRDPVRVDNDPALRGLPEYFGEAHDGNGAGVDDVREHLSRPDRGQLIYVADEQQSSTVGQAAH